MEEALVFGGLSSIGFFLTERLLDAGIRVYSISSATSEEEKDREEENELFLGRNALFQCERDEQRAEGTYLILADTFRINRESNDRLKKRIRRLFVNLPQMQRVLFLSSLEVCGERAEETWMKSPAHPISARGKAANEMELFFVNLLRKIKRKEAVIFRTDLNLISERADGEVIAALIIGLMKKDHEGLDAVHFKKGLDPNAAINKKLSSLLPQDYKKWLQRTT
ncbi:hypothetical protein NIE88_13000 [Sporolactobacillus shoreicorticis]|uniref:Uncharacterized protein n=1 Tax=Sporolactobacillus shoreicorticis TaxID=1923877 RepID=A0ABW5S5K4_9BACL|nr:hypothetical protein [Sporolactobacillus shoreicorticis]MCO7126683.1 hypothetical protein [Sporolactobacillus shoreicorticis]